MKYWSIRIALAFVFCTIQTCFAQAEDIRLDLSGEWRFRMDPEDKGVAEKWYTQDFDQYIHLPGALQNQGYGDDITKETAWVTDAGYSSAWYLHPMYSRYRKKENLRFPNNFQPRKHYVGVAWYKKRISIPKDFKDKEIFLYLERVHWESTLWIDDTFVGTCNSLLAPHVYNLSRYLHPGKEHSITLRVDNREIVRVGAKGHSWGDQTMTAWNGIIGKLNLLARESVYMEDLQIFPDIDARKVRFRYKFQNSSKKAQTAEVAVAICSYNTAVVHKVLPEPCTLKLAPGSSDYVQEIEMTDQMLLWSEYAPNLYKADIDISTTFSKQHLRETFGMREIKARNNRFYLNGEEIYLRGNVLCGSFPQSGYTSMDFSTWKRILTIHKYYGFNHIRFHSWTPPEAAFQAADEVGIYLYTETNVWTHINTAEQEHFLAQEGARALKYYGNHPSFLFMGMGNETSAKIDITDRLLSEWKKDNRRLYTGMANSPHSLSPQCDFTVTREVRPNLGWPPAPLRTMFYTEKPSTDFTFGDPIRYSVPLITHEAGQQCSYPALDQMMKFTGSQFAGYIDIARDQLNERGMLQQWPDFVKASGKLQTLFYKQELEAYLRMPSHTGYELLQLEDFQGQGGALVGILDYFYDNKGYITAEEFRQFCGPRVLLLKMPKLTWKQNETYKAEALFSNWSESELTKAKIAYQIVSEEGHVYQRKIYTPTVIPRGDAVSLGELELKLAQVDAPCKLTVKASLLDSDLVNEWSFWVYPESVPAAPEIAIATEWNDSIAQRIMTGENMILQLDKEQLKRGRELPPCFLPIFWSQLDKMGSSQTMGILCNPKHELFKYFPTAYHTDWQWYELLKDAYPIIFDEYGLSDAWDKTYIPLIQLIDGWKTNRKMGVLAEARLGKGKLVITSMNITDNLEERIVARQFRYSLFQYMNSDAFHPSYSITPDRVKALLCREETRQIHSKIKSIATSGISSEQALAKLMDGNEETVWSGKLQKQGAFLLSLNKEEQVSGIVCLRAGDQSQWPEIEYEVFLSHDGKDWGLPITQGKLNQSGNRTEMGLEYFHGAKYIKILCKQASEKAEIAISEIQVLTE